MPRRQVKRGGRKFQPEKPLIYVFCEGESEQAYAKFLKEHFADVAVLKIPSKTGLFSNATIILFRSIFLDLMNKGSQATSIIVAQYMLKAIF